MPAPWEIEMYQLTQEQRDFIAKRDAELNEWHQTANGVEVYGSKNQAQTENLLLEGIKMVARGRNGEWYDLAYDFELGGIVATPEGGK